MRHHRHLVSLGISVALAILAASPAAAQREPNRILLRPDRVFDGTGAPAHDGWGVLVSGTRIDAVGPVAQLDSRGARIIDLHGTTLLPGLIDAHSHVLLHPYNETSWDDQVLHEPLAVRV